MWENMNKNNKKYELDKDGLVEFVNFYYGEDAKNNTYDVYYPQNGKERMPTIFMFHGGGYVWGQKENTSNFCKLMAKKGFVVFNIEYTKCDKEEKKYFPYPVYEFFKFYKNMTERTKFVDLIDFDNIFLAGNSAGAHIASLVASIQSNQELKLEYGLAGGPRVKGVILTSPSFGVYSFAGLFPKKQFHEVVFGEKAIRNPLYQYTHILRILTEDFPPTLMFSVKKDAVVGIHKKMFLELAEELNLSVQHYEFKSGFELGHSCMVAHPEKYPMCFDKIQEFVKNSKNNIFVDGVIKESLNEAYNEILCKKGKSHF